MTSSSGSTCLNCVELKGKVSKLEETLAFLEQKTRDCVRAYRSVVNEKNVITQNLEQSKELFKARIEEEEKRLANLEASLNELSSICGKYEAENLKKSIQIDKLNQRCDELTQQLAYCEVVGSGQTNESEKFKTQLTQSHLEISKLINKWTQTYIYESKTENVPDKRQLITHDQETQTISEPSNSLSTNKAKKTECAIVVPTHREPEIEKSTRNVDSRRESQASESETVFTDTEFTLNENESQPFESVRPSLNSSNSMVNQEIPSNSVSLFYVNELARKEIELVETRLTARENECALRELRWKYNVDTFKLQSKLTRLEQQLTQIQNDDTTKPNLTYIRNVLVRFLKTKDKKQQTCMMNALLTALGVEQKEVKM